MITFLVMLIVGLSYAIQSTFGFGAGLISLPFLSLLIGVKTSIGMNLIFQLLTGSLLFTVWRDISFARMPVFLACTFAGIITGSLFLGHVDEKLLEFILAFYLIFYASKQRWGHHFPKIQAIEDFKKTHSYAVTCGIPGGLISGAFGTGGPMLVSYIKSLHLSKDSMRATILFVMFFCNTIRISMTLKMGQLDKDVVHYALAASPAFMLGILGGNVITKRLTEEQFRSSIDLIILGAGVTLLAKHLFF